MTDAAKWCSPVEYDQESASRPEPKRWRGPNHVSDEKIELARSMERAGIARTQVCKKLGVNKTTLWRRLGRANREDKQ